MHSFANENRGKDNQSSHVINVSVGLYLGLRAMLTHQKLKEKTVHRAGAESTETERIKAAKVILYASDLRVNLETGQKTCPDHISWQKQKNTTKSLP